MSDTNSRIDIGIFPNILLLVQIILLLFSIFGFNYSIICAFTEFIGNSSLFLSLANILCIFYFFKKKENKKYNFFICLLNIILLNKLYDNRTIGNIAHSMSKINIEVVIFIMIILSVFGLFYYFWRRNNSNNNIVKNAQATNSFVPISDSIDDNQENYISHKDRKNMMIITLSITIIIVLIVVLIFYFLYKNPSIFTYFTQSENIIIYVLLIISSIILLIVLLPAASQFIYSTIVNIPDNIEKIKRKNDRILKFTMGVALLPIFYWATTVYKPTSDWLLNLLSQQNFMVLPFVLCIFIILSMVFVEILFGLFSDSSSSKWATSFKGKFTGPTSEIIGICESLIKSLIRIARFIPDFIKTLEIILLDYNENKEDDNSYQNANPFHSEKEGL